MISTSVIKKFKLDSESLKPLFDAKKLREARGQGDKTGKGKKPDSELGKRVKLVDMLSSRIKDGRTRQLKDYRVWAAVDMAYDAPFYQETPTILRHILATCSGGDKTTATEEVIGAAKRWGLAPEDICCTVKDANGKDAIALNAPVFNQIVMPYVRSIMGTRLSKLFNDRNTVPLLEYEPQKKTELNRVRCEIITDVVQAMSTQFGYSAVLRQLIFNTLMYSTAIAFPMEPWKQYKHEDENGKEVIEKQGIRYVVPHITRMFWDQTYPLNTANTNTGCSFAGYWTVMKWGDVGENSQYWNTDDVMYGHDWLSDNDWSNYFQTAYPCALKHPKPPAAQGAGDREQQAAMYTDTDNDKAVFVTHIFAKLVPKDWGLGDYKNEVWFRFTFASDDTIIWADAFPYNPLIVSQYDADQNRARNASFALDAIAGQDEMTNLINQWLLTMKRNLANVIFYDVNQIPDPGTIESLRARTHWQYMGMNFVPKNSFKDKAFQGLGAPTKGTCFEQVTFAQGNTQEMLQGLNSVIAFWDRMLGISAQELGSAASHQQGNKEIDLIASSSSNRVAFTGSFIDEARGAWKQQLYDANICYMPNDVVGQVSTNIPNLDKHLKELGFTVQGEADDQRKVQVKGKKDKLMLESFASTAQTDDRQADIAAGTAQMNALAAMNQNPRTAQIIDPTSMVDAYEEAAKMQGAPKDFNIKTDKNAMEVQSVQRAMPEIVAAVEKDVEAKMVKPLVDALKKAEEANVVQDQQTNQLATVVTQLVEKVKGMEAALAQPPVAPPPLVPALTQPLTPDATGTDPTTGLQIQAAPQMAGPVGV